MNAFELETRLIEFASRGMEMSDSMPQSYGARHLGSQIIRSATSPALNYGEAQAAESREDFIHKMKICQKELRETLVCLKLIEKRGWFAQGKMTAIINESNELIAIFVASNKTAQTKKVSQTRSANQTS
jgi:four helix bundle protein